MTGASPFFERIRLRGNPVAASASTVVRGKARFTVLTPRLIRLEWSATGVFQDRSTFAFPNRAAPTPPFTATESGGVLRIDTGALQLRYQLDGGPIKATNLRITLHLNDEEVTLTPGMPNPGNLRGTRRTLDGAAGPVALGEGLLSRDGWAVHDDSRSVVFTEGGGWVAPRPGHDLQDWYFFGYGHAYTEALAEYTLFGGQVPLIPRFVLGAWWSRFWAYSAQDLEQLVSDFAAHDLPLDVLVLDMDWHTPHGWTGYTWNRDLFPDPAGFLRWAHDWGLRVTLNLHPAEGVQAFEEVYPRFASALGVDPATRAAVHATGKPLVGVLMSGRPLVIPRMARQVAVLLQAWHAGIAAGRAVADILFGAANPSGKLTAGFPYAEGQIPVYYAHKNTGRPAEGAGTVQFEEAFKSRYLDVPNEPLFPFGYGLSFTTFSYGELAVETPVVGPEDTLVVSAVVRNTGERAGDEVVQLYVRDLVGSTTRPVKELKGFGRFTLQPGEEQTVRFEVPVRELGHWGLDMRYAVEPGAFKVWIGPDSTQGLEGEFAVS